MRSFLGRGEFSVETKLRTPVPSSPRYLSHASAVIKKLSPAPKPVSPIVNDKFFSAPHRLARSFPPKNTCRLVSIANWSDKYIFPDNKAYDEKFSIHLTFASRTECLFFLRLFCLCKIRPR